ncbi:hypothetical protein VPH35_053145 [Triticum aestivum]|uniref:Uncharacterized protein n=1 Tax=Triticum aestivum TaxID=4565 RepID=A0A077S4P8_WHEAT|nr:unnamed protein product [Triticum aestivum]
MASADGEAASMASAANGAASMASAASGAASMASADLRRARAAELHPWRARFLGKHGRPARAPTGDEGAAAVLQARPFSREGWSAGRTFAPSLASFVRYWRVASFAWAPVVHANARRRAGSRGRTRASRPGGAAGTRTASGSKNTRRRWPGSASAPSVTGHGPASKRVCASATHAVSFKCHFHRTNSQGHGHGQGQGSRPSLPPSPAAANAVPRHPASPSSSSSTVATQ